MADYSLRFKGQDGWDDTWVAGYNNELLAYIPSLRVSKEGSYEGAEGMKEYGLPAPFGHAIEELIAEKVVAGLAVFATAGAANKAVALVYNDIRPHNGVIAIRCEGATLQGGKTKAMVQAIEIGPGDGGTGSVPKTLESPLH